jgi:hypothetical protein
MRRMFHAVSLKIKMALSGAGQKIRNVGIDELFDKATAEGVKVDQWAEFVTAALLSK